jgi:hypothetical protein
MSLAALAAALLFAAEPGQASTPAPQAAAPAADQAQIKVEDDDNDGVPANAPKDDYRFVAWCYGALDEYLQIYDQVKPDLKAIDKMFGSPVKEDEPYHDDIVEDRKALKRFAAAIEAAEKASLHPIAPEGAAAMQGGRDIWAEARLQPSRKLADAWLFWGVPNRCDKVAGQLKARATLLGQAFAVEAPRVDPASAPAEPPKAVSAEGTAANPPPAPSATDTSGLKGPQ